eukprot:3517872-Pyramimonas_sp.AAC.1
MLSAGYGRRGVLAVLAGAVKSNAAVSQTPSSLRAATHVNINCSETASITREFTAWPRVAYSVGGELGAVEGTAQSSWAFRAGGAVLFGATAIAFGRCPLVSTFTLS